MFCDFIAQLKMSKKTKIVFNFLILITIIIGVFDASLFFNQNNANNKEYVIIRNNNIDDKTLNASLEINNETIDSKLLEVANTKLEVANEKEAAYNVAVNQLKLYVAFFGTLLIIIAVLFGFYKDNKIVEARDELLNSVEEKKKYLEENNSLSMEKKMFELEKRNNIELDKIKALALGDIKDLQNRIKNIEENNEGEISFEDKNPYE